MLFHEKKMESFISSSDPFFSFYSHLITQIGTYEFCQGRTMRWGLCWIVPASQPQPSSSVASNISFPISPFRAERKSAKPFKFVVPKKTDAEYKLSLIAWRVKTLLDEVNVENKEVPSDKVNVVNIRIKSFEKTWTNQRWKQK